MSILEKAISIVREAEHLVIGPWFRSRWRPLESTLDAVVHVPWFLIAGAQERLALFGFALVLVPIWWCILAVAIWVAGTNSAAATRSFQGWIIAALLAAGSVIFRLPSRPIRLSRRLSQVSRLASHIRSLAEDEATIKLLQSGVATLDSAASQRITRINWLLGIFWAGLIWVASHWVFATDVSEATRQVAVMRVLAGFLIFLFFGAGITSYEAAMHAVKQTIDFAFLEASYAQTTQGPTSRTTEYVASAGMIELQKPGLEKAL